ncbi:Methylmalonyl-CoA mutase [Sarcoptes scabiei]|nr:Methylmalonyl-CoA mutase [Sarcoptes scabiei]
MSKFFLCRETKRYKNLIDSMIWISIVVPEAVIDFVIIQKSSKPSSLCTSPIVIKSNVPRPSMQSRRNDGTILSESPLLINDYPILFDVRNDLLCQFREFESNRKT